MLTIDVDYNDGSSSVISEVEDFHYNSTYESFIMKNCKNEIIIPRENVRAIEVKYND